MKVARNINNFVDLATALVQEWITTRDAMILRYVRSIRRRMIACIDRRGGHNATRY